MFRALVTTSPACKTRFGTGCKNPFFSFVKIEHTLWAYPHAGPAAGAKDSIVLKDTLGFTTRRIELPDRMYPEFFKQSCRLRGTPFHDPSKVKA